ncbi:MAG: prenyltransferase/squalene oxidase repeat-containing protein [Verrucomicrobiales bacterium]|nr:terpene cyclase/mutase family protein [Verrucomicrobiota bacterium JB025]
MKLLIPAILLTATIARSAPAKADQFESIKQEIRQSIARGNKWLSTKQNDDGSWDDGQLPAITGLVLHALVRDPNLDKSKPLPAKLEKGYTWLLAQQKDDGGIYNRGLSVYNTAASITSLMAAGREDFEPAVVKARKHLIDNQWDLGQTKETDNANDGGIGYGSDNTHTDLSNTYLALEALAASEQVVQDGKYGDQPQLDWQAAITFISRCQNLEETNDQEFASNDEKNKGGFIYSPFASKAGEEQSADGRTALRSYGSMSYAGLLSMVYAKVSPTDPRVVAVKEWLANNFTLAENPGMGAQGLYYYYQLMAKGLTAANVTELQLADGKKIDWRNQLADKILATQRENGSWINENGRWMESNPVLVTSYTVLALEQILASFPN